MIQRTVGSMSPVPSPHPNQMHLEGRQLLLKGPEVAECLGANSKPTLGLRRALASFSCKMSTLLALHGTKEIALERDRHTFLPAHKYIFYMGTHPRNFKASEGTMVCVEAKSFYRHLFRNTFHLVRWRYCRDVTQRWTGRTMHIPPWVIRHMAGPTIQSEEVGGGKELCAECSPFVSLSGLLTHNKQQLMYSPTI